MLFMVLVLACIFNSFSKSFHARPRFISLSIDDLDGPKPMIESALFCICTCTKALVCFGNCPFPVAWECNDFLGYGRVHLRALESAVFPRLCGSQKVGWTPSFTVWLLPSRFLQSLHPIPQLHFRLDFQEKSWRWHLFEAHCPAFVGTYSCPYTTSWNLILLVLTFLGHNHPWSGWLL